MNSKFSAAFVFVVSLVIALVGLFMAARAEDFLFGFHGWIFVIFGVLMCFYTGAKMTQE
jgi:uncharacterized Tic20 family protein